jgi:hypothetical protein
MTARIALPALSICAVALTCALTSTAFAAEAAPRDCFDGTRVVDWTAVGDQTVFLKTQTSDYYRIDLARPIRQLHSPAARLTVTSNARTVCGPNDLSVDLFLTSSMNMPLGVAKLTKLSTEDVAAAGPENLPGRRYRGVR